MHLYNRVGLTISPEQFTCVAQTLIPYLEFWLIYLCIPQATPIRNTIWVRQPGYATLILLLITTP